MGSEMGISFRLSFSSFSSSWQRVFCVFWILNLPLYLCDLCVMNYVFLL